MTEFITWTPYFSVGDESLDADHKTIVGLINRLHAALAGKRTAADLRQIADELIRYTVTHFQHEEQVMFGLRLPRSGSPQVSARAPPGTHDRFPHPSEHRQGTGNAPIPEKLVVQSHSGQGQDVYVLPASRDVVEERGEGLEVRCRHSLPVNPWFPVSNP